MGLCVNPEGATIQMEGCIMMGLGYTFTEEVFFEGGNIHNRGFDSYQIPRFSWVPKMILLFLERKDKPPQGGGEPAIIGIGAVVANAIFDATGARLYRMPMTPARVLEAIEESHKINLWKYILLTTKVRSEKIHSSSVKVYKNDPVWIPPLLDEQFSQFDARRNPTLDHCEYSLFLLVENDEVIGRIAAFIDKLALDTWKEPVGLFGYYECIDDKKASVMLLECCRSLAQEKGNDINARSLEFCIAGMGIGD